MIAELPRHNQIVYARCVCRDEWSGNDCTIEPPPPPTLEPWPDPYSGSSAPPRLGALMTLRSALLATSVVFLCRHALPGVV